MKVFLYFLLLCITQQIEIQFVGTMSLFDIFVMVYFFIFCMSSRHRKKFFFNKDCKLITFLYISLFLCSLCMELIIGNSMSNTMKGLAVIALSYMKFFFFVMIFNTHPERIWKYIICLIISYILFTSPEENVSAASIISGETFNFFKFKIAPRIGEALVVFSLIKVHKKKRVASYFIFLGASCVILGARSTGLMIMLTGFFGWIIINRQKLSRRILLRWSIPSIIVLYFFYVIYVNAILSGAIIGGNSHEQITKVENPYNPIYVLLAGRTESPASIAAIADKPLTGHGAWAKDYGWKYHLIALQYAGDEYKREMELMRRDIIPTHSVILGIGVNNGIIAMFLMILILVFIIRKGYMSLTPQSPYLFLVIFSLMQIIWNGLFSPLAHFRNMLPFYFVCCLLSYRYYTEYTSKKYNNICIKNIRR